MTPPARAMFVKIGDRVYGPYARDQVDGFVREGRLTPKTMASYTSDHGFEPLWKLLEQATPPPAAAPSLMAQEPAPQEHAAPATSLYTYLIVADILTGAATAFEEQVLKAGTAVMLMPSTWYLVSELPLTGIRSQLSRVLPPGDRFVIVDPVRNRMAWHNLGVEVDARLRMARNLAAQGAQQAVA